MATIFTWKFRRWPARGWLPSTVTSSPSRSRMVTICMLPSGPEAWNCMPTSSSSTPSNMLAQGADQLGGVFAVCIFRLDGHFQFIADILAVQCLFQTRNDVTCTLQVNQRRAAGRTVDDLTSVVGQGIVDGDSLVGGDRHGGETFCL